MVITWTVVRFVQPALVTWSQASRTLNFLGCWHCSWTKRTPWHMVFVDGRFVLVVVECSVGLEIVLRLRTDAVGWGTWFWKFVDL